MNDAARLASLLLEDDGAWDFTSSIDARYVSITGTPDNWELQTMQCIVKWHLEFEVRQWGVKEFNPSLRSVEFIANFEILDPETGEKVDAEQVELRYPSPAVEPGDDVKSALDRYAHDVQAEIQWHIRSGEDYSPSVFPKDVEIDLKTNQIVVFF